MFRSICSAFLIAVILAGCSESTGETSFVSEAVAGPASQQPNPGWRTSVSPNAVDGTVTDYQ
jgi:hypothetical protein